MINFTIIEYEGDVKQVLFGWGHHKFDDQGHVISSTDPIVVAMFDKMFQALNDKIEPPAQANIGSHAIGQVVDRETTEKNA